MVYRATNKKFQQGKKGDRGSSITFIPCYTFYLNLGSSKTVISHEHRSPKQKQKGKRRRELNVEIRSCFLTKRLVTVKNGEDLCVSALTETSQLAPDSVTGTSEQESDVRVHRGLRRGRLFCRRKVSLTLPTTEDRWRCRANLSVRQVPAEGPTVRVTSRRSRDVSCRLVEGAVRFLPRPLSLTCHRDPSRTTRFGENESSGGLGG